MRRTDPATVGGFSWLPSAALIEDRYYSTRRAEFRLKYTIARSTHADQCNRDAGKLLPGAAPWLKLPDEIVKRPDDLQLGGTAAMAVGQRIDDVPRGFRSLQKTFGDRLTTVIVQPVSAGGGEVTISMLQEQI
jgi:hypothetical protein